MELPDLGRRGGGWVAGQFVLLGIIVVTAWWGYRDSPPELPRLALGGVVAVAGAAAMIWAAAALGSALVPWPRPVGEGVVREGPYRWVRHPIYSGGLLLCLGAAVAATWWVVLPTAALALLWALKCRVEERMLATAFSGYAAYCAAVRWRMVPGVY